MPLPILLPQLLQPGAQNLLHPPVKGILVLSPDQLLKGVLRRLLRGGALLLCLLLFHLFLVHTHSSIFTHAPYCDANCSNPQRTTAIASSASPAAATST